MPLAPRRSIAQASRSARWSAAAAVALVASVALAATVIAVPDGHSSSAQGRRPPASSRGPGELPLVPTQANLLLFVDVAALSDSPSLLKMRDRIPLFPRVWRSLEEFLSATGLRLDRDIDRVTVGGREMGEGKGMVMLVRGRVDPASLSQRLTQRGWSTERLGEATLLLGPEPKERNAPEKGQAGHQRSTDRPVLCFPEKNIALWGDRLWVAESLRRLSAGRSSDNVNPELSRLVSAISGRGQAWLVAADPQIARQAIKRLVPPQAAPAVDAVADIDTLAVSIRSGKGVSVRGEAGSRGEQQAGLFADSLRAVIALLKVTAQSDGEALAALRSIRIEQDGRTVTVAGEIPASLIQRRE